VKVIDVLRRLSKSPLSFQVHAGRGDPITLGIENRDPITAVALVVEYEFVSVIAVRAGCHLDANERIPTRTDTMRALPPFSHPRRDLVRSIGICLASPPIP